MLETCIFYIHAVKQALCQTNKVFFFFTNSDRDYLHPVISFTKQDALYIP